MLLEAAAQQGRCEAGHLQLLAGRPLPDLSPRRKYTFSLFLFFALTQGRAQKEEAGVGASVCKKH